MNEDKLKDAVRARAPDGYKPVKHWIYPGADGAMAMAVARYNAAGNGHDRPKQYRPFISDGNGGFLCKFPDGLRPLYNLDKLGANPEAVVIVVEGEKVADALSEMLPDYVVTTSAGGSCQAKRSDWGPLEGRTVYVLPDANQPGLRYAADVAGLVPEAKVVDPPAWAPTDWDAADPFPAGRSVDDIAIAISTASSPSANGKAPNGTKDLGAATRKAIGSRLVFERADQISPEPVSWLWKGRIARGKHTCMAGEPGTGKSQLTISIIAALTSGAKWPCGEGTAEVSGSVIVLSAEDGAADTIVPRLIAAGADRSKVHLVSAVTTEDGSGRRSFNLKADLELLEKMIEDVGDVCMVVIDPISSYLGGTDSHKNADVRGVLEPIGEMGERHDVAIVSVTHFSKAGIGTTTKALHRFIGSIAFVGAPRVALAVMDDPDNTERRLVLHAKNNLAPAPQGLAFRLEQKVIGAGADSMFASCIKWELEPVDITADTAMAGAKDGGEKESKMENALDFIRQSLKPGEHVAVADFNKEAESLGISLRTLERARAKLGVKSLKGDFAGGWALYLLQVVK